MEKALNVMYALREAVSLSKNYPSDEILDEAIAELEEVMKPKTCAGCKTLPFILTELTKNNGGKCGICKRYLKDNYEAESKDNA